MAYDAKLSSQLVAASVPLAGSVRIFVAEDDVIKTASVDEILSVVNLEFDVQVNEIADRDDYDAEAEGYRVLVSDAGDGRAALYSRFSATPGVWSGPAFLTVEGGGGGGIDDDFINSIAELGTAADRYIYTTAVDTAAEGVITAAARALLAGVSYNAILTTLTATRPETGAISRAVLDMLRDRISVKDFGAVGDGRLVTGGSGITATDTTFNADPDSFTADDVGKLIGVRGAGAAGGDLITTVASFVDDETVELTDPAGSTVASSYAMIGTDNTDAFNDAIEAVGAVGGILVFPAGTYVSGSIAVTNRIGVILKGTGKQSGAGPSNYGTHLWPLVAAGTNTHCVDLGGSTHIRLEDLQIGRSDLVGKADCGVLVAAYSGAESTHQDIINCFVIGKFKYAALYRYGVPDCAFDRSQFYNYENTGFASAVVHTATNVRGVSSPNGTLNTGTIDTSMTSMRKSHIIEQGNGAAQSLCCGMLLDGVSALNLDGCNLISTNAHIVIADQAVGCELLKIQNSVFGSGYQAHDAHIAIRCDTTLTIRGLILEDNLYNDDGAAEGGGPGVILNMANSGRIDNVRITGGPFDGSAKVVAGGVSAGLRGVNWDIDCGGLPIDLPHTIQGLILRRPGAITTIAGGSFTQPGQWEEFEVDISGDETTNLTTGTNKRTKNMRFGFQMVGCRASLNTVSSSGLPTFDINKNGTTCLSTKLTIDASEKTSDTATTPAVISVSAFAAGDEMGFDVDIAGTGAKGAKVQVWGWRTS